jgi:NAD(P)-dependent dehydrogenase (short-subunit alcohol dehydrogenase family)
MRADVCDSDQMKSAFAETINRFGRFDILFNKAGITTPQPGFTRVPIFTGEKSYVRAKARETS